MVTQDGLMRIFWPSENIKHGTQGVLVGWRNSDSDIFVTAVLRDVELRSVESALRLGTLFRDAAHPIQTLFSRCGHKSLHAVGLLNPEVPALSISSTMVSAYTQKRSTLPRIYTEAEATTNVQVIVYVRPDPSRMQFMSINPISLALENRHTKPSVMNAQLDSIDRAEQAERIRKAALVEKVKLHTVTRFPTTAKETALPEIISQVNCSFELNGLLQKNLRFIRRRARRALSISERVTESASDLYDYSKYRVRGAFHKYVFPVLLQAFIRTLMAHRMVGELIIIVANWRLKSSDLALRDVSATAQQVDLRLQQFCYWPIQYLTLRKRKNDWQSVTGSHPEYIRFLNSLWLVANDVIIGIAIGSYIIANAEALAIHANMVIRTWSLSGLQRVIAWLMVYPAGLKLNNDLAKFLGDLFLWVIEFWAGCMTTLEPSFPHVMRFIGFASFAGASMPLALISDLISFLTLHIYCFYIGSARIYNWQLSIIISLFHLFRGKKRNVLRNRIDSCDYELDQLLLGTILFTLLFFLLPTVAVFYLTFALERMAIISLKAALDTMLAGLNHFPLFALMLRVKDSRRLPGGICFELKDTPNELMRDSTRKSPRQVSYISLKSTPLSLRAIFHEYSQFGHRIRKHYLAPSVLLRFVTGAFVPPLHRINLYGLQYSMLPAQRVGIVELWRSLNGSPIAIPAQDKFVSPTSANSSSGSTVNGSAEILGGKRYVNNGGIHKRA